MNTTYTCTGSVRGNCGHRHQTIKAAVKCCERDQASCKSQGGYSDFDVKVIVDGVLRDMTEGEHDESLSYRRWARA